MVTLYISELSCPRMTAIAILTMLAILVGSTLSITGFSVVSSVEAQMAGDNATMSGNMTGGNATEGNMSGTSGSISSTDIVNDADDPE
jgi:xanthosine utilization system XapX-like protein